MPVSEYIRNLRRSIGNGLLLIPSVSAVMHDDQGRILLARHAHGDVWAFPGGAIEPMEHPHDAVAREMREETGLEVQVVRTIGSYGGPTYRWRYPNGDEVCYVIIALEVESVGGEMRPDNDEVLELRFFALDEIEAIEDRVWMQPILDDFARITSSSTETPSPVPLRETVPG